MIRLKDYRTRAQGVPDLLVYAGLVDPGIIKGKDGCLLAGWRVRGQDTASSTFSELEWISARANDALRQLGTGWMLHMSADRKYSRAYPSEESSQFPDPVTQMIDDERRAFFGADWCYTTDTVICLTYKPNIAEAQMARLAKSGAVDSLEAETRKYFLGMLEQFEDVLSSVLRMQRLTEHTEYIDGRPVLVSDLLSHIQLCLTGESYPVRVPPDGMYLDAILGAGDLVLDGTTPVLGDQRIAVVAIDSFTQESWPAMLSCLDTISTPFRFTIRFIFLDQWDALKELNKSRKGWQQGTIRVMDHLTGNKTPRVNRDAAAMVEDAEQAEQDARSGAVGFGYITACVVLMDPDQKQLMEKARDFRSRFAQMGFNGRIETLNCMEAWLGTHPGNSWSNVRRPLINTLNLADCLPLSSAWTGHRYNPCPYYPPKSRPLAILTTDGNTPYRFNLHKGDLGHTIILGPTGSGKSTLLALIAAQFRAYPNSSIFVFDKGLSMYALAKGVGADHYDIGHDALAFAPLQHLDESEEEFAWVANWVANLAELQRMQVAPVHRNACHLALETLRNNPQDMRSLTDLYNVLQNQPLKEALRHYTVAGTMGHLLDAKTDNLKLSRFVVFEIESLMEMGEANLIPVLLYLFHRIEKALQGQPALLLLDEAWVMLGHPVFREQIRGWFKTFRRKNCAIGLATQSISDAANSGIMDVVFESCPTEIFLPNHRAEDKASLALYELAGLNERQINIIKQMVPKQDYYIVQPSGRRRVQLALGPRSLAFVGASDRESVSRLQSLIAEYPDTWRDIWLRERGVILM